MGKNKTFNSDNYLLMCRCALAFISGNTYKLQYFLTFFFSNFHVYVPSLIFKDYRRFMDVVSHQLKPCFTGFGSWMPMLVSLSVMSSENYVCKHMGCTEYILHVEFNLLDGRKGALGGDF